MQTKYKILPSKKQETLGAIRGYEEYKREYLQQQEEILSFGSKNYSEHTEYNPATKKTETSRVYIAGGGYSGSQTEDKALQLEALERSHGALVVKAVDTAKLIMLAELAVPKTNAERELIVQKLYESCKYGRNFIFEECGISCIARSRFYQHRERFIYIIAEKLGYLC